MAFGETDKRIWRVPASNVVPMKRDDFISLPAPVLGGQASFAFSQTGRSGG